MPVTLISSPAELPADTPGTLVVLVTDEPAAAATEVAEVLEAAPPCTPSEALARLEARDETLVAAACPALPDEATVEASLLSARQAVADALARVPPRARGIAPERLRRAAAAVAIAQEAAVEARALLGERPELATDAAEAALAAEEAVTRAREQRTVGMDRSSKVLVGANAAGILIIAGRIRTPLLDPVFVLVAACPLAALGYMTATVASRTMDARVATRRRREALRSTGMATMTGLAARHARVKAWAARAEALAAAEASLGAARKRWSTLAGASTDPADAGALVEALEEAGRASAALAELEATVPAAQSPPEPARGLVVLAEGASDHDLDDQTRELLGRLLDGAPIMDVVVSASPAIRCWAESQTDGHVAAEVFDLRERVVASLDRLRARAAAFRDTVPPDSMAADG